MYKTAVDVTVATHEVAGRREELKAQNRGKLLAAARKVFAEKGLGAATARDIVRETDLASGTFYNYFEDKNDVFRALIAELADKAREVVRAQRRVPGRTVEERLEAPTAPTSSWCSRSASCSRCCAATRASWASSPTARSSRRGYASCSWTSSIGPMRATCRSSTSTTSPRRWWALASRWPPTCWTAAAGHRRGRPLLHAVVFGGD